ncbi:MAG: hypothetical protein GY757_04570, partial [bacterium]|nr:hypothetical protein [bacterium]
ISRRDHLELQDIIGLIMESIVIRSYLPEYDTFAEFLQKIKHKTLTAYEHQAYPYDELLTKLESTRNNTRKLITRSALIVQNMETSISESTSEEEGEAELLTTGTSKMDLTITAWESPTGEDKKIVLDFSYSSELFKKETIENLSLHFIDILKEAAADPETRLADFLMMDADKFNMLPDGHAPYHQLSHPQKRILDMERAFPNTSVGTLAFTIRYPQLIDKELLEKAINSVLEKNEGLHLRLMESRFYPQLLQYAALYKHYPLESFDFSGDDSEERMRQWLQKDTQTPFHTVNANLFYFAYVRYNEKEAGYYMKVHHIAVDGWSVALLLSQIHNAYEALAAGREPDATPAPSYIQFLEDERNYLKSQQAEEDREFWHRTLLPLPDPIDISSTISKFADIKGHVHKLLIPPGLRTLMLAFCREQGTSIYKLMLSALSIYISRTLGKEDIV